ncbi:hypothetical protein Goklo_020242 [Gossypium klotzschianum]|uniref:Aspergillus nuclease S1 n=1 Tax=Gossypium klotzschianum TaxID=34286 RepID=A0A7J8URD1_9ROSI|nr:hypothetical protein [Gossypium klotzschianum]
MTLFMTTFQQPNLVEKVPNESSSSYGWFLRENYLQMRKDKSIHYHWSSPLHYVDTPDFKCNYKYCSKFKSWILIGDCHDTAGHKDSCVTGALI